MRCSWGERFGKKQNLPRPCGFAFPSGAVASHGKAGLGWALLTTHRQGWERSLTPCLCVFFLLKVVWGEVGSNDQSGGLGWKERE